MRIMDILKNCPYEKFESKIKLHYGISELDKCRKLYYELKNMTITKKLLKDLYVYITAYKEIEDYEDIKVDNFDENDTTLYFDVSGYEISGDIIYSISASCYSDFLQYKIDKKTLEIFSPETILAHCFWEITSYGYEDNI